MLGVGGASVSVTAFATRVARPAVEKKIAGVALTKTVWYGPMKQVLRVIGVKLTKDSFAKAVSKTVPVASGVISGGLTFTSLRVQSRRLTRHLRQIPPPHVDAHEYLQALRRLDGEMTEKDGRSLRSRIGAAASVLARPARAEDGGHEATADARDENAKPGTGGVVASTVSSIASRAGAVFSRTRRGENGEDASTEASDAADRSRE